MFGIFQCRLLLDFPCPCWEDFPLPDFLEDPECDPRLPSQLAVVADSVVADSAVVAASVVEAASVELASKMAAKMATAINTEEGQILN